MSTHLSCHLVVFVVLKMVVLEHHIHGQPLAAGTPMGGGGGEEGEGHISSI